MTEAERLQDYDTEKEDWKKWGSYLSERAWGTVREDYSADGSAWDYFPHDHARSRAYRWNEDGLLGICDRHQYLCFAPSLWNHHDPILKERAFGLTGSQGNHGEDVKDYYFFLDNTPTHSYMKALYKYPQSEYPYQNLIEENARRTRNDPEYELFDTGIFAGDRYFDVFVEYAKSDPEDMLIRFTIINRGPDAAPLTFLPTVWFRNTWAWGERTSRPKIEAVNAHTLHISHPELGERTIYCEQAPEGPELIFTENETNYTRLYGPNASNITPYVKDGFHECIVHNNKAAVNPARFGTKAGACYRLELQPGESRIVRMRLTPNSALTEPFAAAFDEIMASRIKEADEFYMPLAPPDSSDEIRKVQRQSLAGMLWSKQFYHFSIKRWLDGDPGFPEPPVSRKHGRDCEWTHLDNFDIFCMPDTWEYPWYAAWDCAFHCISLAIVDSTLAKRQLILLCREWSMHPNGQMPAYEWAFGDVNPPVHAWAALRVYRIEKRIKGIGDRNFLERIFLKLLLNFTWWVNRKDPEGRNVFQGGFLGMDNIGVFDRSAPLPGGEALEQSDGTAWMGFFCLSMFAIALELSQEEATYEDMAIKFFEHFLYIASAMNNIGDAGISLWDDQDRFYYDVLRLSDCSSIPIRARSMVGLIPLLAVETCEESDLERMPAFTDRINWFFKNRPDLAALVPRLHEKGESPRRLLALTPPDRLKAVLHRLLDPNEFLSDHGIRSVSKIHAEHPFVLNIDGSTRSVDYEPAESRTALFGGNSNWRGPIWFPINYLIIEALQRFDYYYGATFKVKDPSDTGKEMTLWQVSQELSRRLTHLFLPDENGKRPYLGNNDTFQTDPNWHDYLLFNEYFHGDTGMGLGASHQTGWTGLVAKLIQQSGE